MRSFFVLEFFINKLSKNSELCQKLNTINNNIFTDSGIMKQTKKKKNSFPLIFNNFLPSLKFCLLLSFQIQEQTDTLQQSRFSFPSKKKNSHHFLAYVVKFFHQYCFQTGSTTIFIITFKQENNLISQRKQTYKIQNCFPHVHQQTSKIYEYTYHLCTFCK